MSDANAGGGERHSDLAVMEAQEYKQKRRLERLLDVLEKVEAKANEAWDLFVAGEINHDAKNIMIQRAVKEAIRETYNHLIDHEEELANDEDGERHSEYWVGFERLKQTDNGSVVPVAGDGGAEPIGVISQQSQADIYIWGLADFMETKEFYEEAITETTKPRNQPARTETKTIQKTVPEDVSWNAYLRLKRFLDQELSLDIQFEELGDSLPTWGFEEVPDEEGTEATAPSLQDDEEVDQDGDD